MLKVSESEKCQFNYLVILVYFFHVKGRGMIKKAVLPFLLGLKLKTTVLVPIALALIALKTWKAMTLGLLSLVLSGALVVFKIAKPKVSRNIIFYYFKRMTLYSMVFVYFKDCQL